MRAWLSDLRRERGLTQKQMAKMLSITEQSYYYIEAGKRQKDMSLSFMNSISDIFGISLEDIKEMELKDDANKGVRKNSKLVS